MFLWGADLYRGKRYRYDHYPEHEKGGWVLRYIIMKILLAIALFGIIGTITYVSIAKPFTKREGEVTFGDLMEESRSNLDHFLATGEKSGPSKLGVISPATYEGTLLVWVTPEERGRIRATATEVPFTAYMLTKVPKGFTLWGSGSSGVENTVPLFQVFFRHENGDLLQTYQYDLKKYLAQYKKTLAEFTKGKEWAVVGDKKIYVSNGRAITEGTYKYAQGATAITDTTIMRVEYTGVTKLSVEDLTALVASFEK